MGAAYFYHLTQRSMEDTLSMLLGKARGAGWRVAVRGREVSRMVHLDNRLWQGDGFVPHGVAGGDHDAAQPILLTTQPDCPNGATCIMSVDGAEVTADEVAQMERVCVLFEDYDEALSTARRQWKALKDAGASAQYWSDESGGWEKKAET